MQLTKFQNHLKLNTNTLNTQLNCLNRVKCFFDEFEEFNQDNINAYLSKRLDGISKSTFNQTLIALRHYAIMEGIEITFPKYKKLSTTEKDYLTEDELIKELIPYYHLVFQQKSDFYIFITKFLFFTGVRPNEMCTLRTEDIHFDKNYFIIRDPKNHRDKKVPFPNSLIPSMKKYLQTGELFAYNTSYASMYRMFNTLNKQLKYKKTLNIYMLRHSYAHYLLDNGVPIEKLQILMGHSDLKTTMIYAKPLESEAIKSYFENIKPKR